MADSLRPIAVSIRSDGLRLDVEDVQLHAELRGLAQRRGELHAGRRRLLRLVLHSRPQRTENEPQHDDRSDHDDRRNRVDGDRRDEECSEAGAGDDDHQQRTDEHGTLLGEGRQEVLQAPGSAAVLFGPRSSHEASRQFSADTGDNGAREGRRLPGRRHGEQGPNNDQSQCDRHGATDGDLDPRHDPESVVALGDRKGGTGDDDEEQRFGESAERRRQRECSNRTAPPAQQCPDVTT